MPSGQRRFYDEPRASNVEQAQPGDFELQVAEGEPPARKHGPLTEAPASPPGVWLRRAPMAPRRERASKGWRRHLRRTKALTRTGRAGS